MPLLSGCNICHVVCSPHFLTMNIKSVNSCLLAFSELRKPFLEIAEMSDGAVKAIAFS